MLLYIHKPPIGVGETLRAAGREPAALIFYILAKSMT